MKDSPLGYLLDLSVRSTESFMLARLAVAARIRKDLKEDIEKLVQALVDAEVASLILRGELQVTKPQVDDRKEDAA